MANQIVLWPFLGDTWCRLHTINLKWPTRQKDVFHLTTQIIFTCIGADHTNGGGVVKFSILSQSIPWCFSGPSLLQTVQLVLLTKANVKGHIETNSGGFWILMAEGPDLLSSQIKTEAKGGRRWEGAMAREQGVITTDLRSADYVSLMLKKQHDGEVWRKVMMMQLV